MAEGSRQPSSCTEWGRQFHRPNQRPSPRSLNRWRRLPQGLAHGQTIESRLVRGRRRGSRSRRRLPLARLQERVSTVLWRYHEQRWHRHVRIRLVKSGTWGWVTAVLVTITGAAGAYYLWSNNKSATGGGTSGGGRGGFPIGSTGTGTPGGGYGPGGPAGTGGGGSTGGGSTGGSGTGRLGRGQLG